MKRFDGIQAVTYDCWGTLLKDRDWQGAHELRLSALRRFLDLEEADAEGLLAEAWARHDDAWKQVETFGPGDGLLRFFAIYYAATSVIAFLLQTLTSRAVASGVPWLRKPFDRISVLGRSASMAILPLICS